jgi:hypothetical protein
MLRILYQDAAGRRLVFRTTLDESDAGFTSYKFSSTGELLTLTFNSGGLTATMQLGGQSFTFDETQPGSTSTRQQAASLIAGASSAFRDSLEQLTRDGFKYLTDFGVAAETLQTIFFYNSVTPTERVAAKVVQDYVSVFDSNTTQPCPFESQFGADYYQ